MAILKALSPPRGSLEVLQKVVEDEEEEEEAEEVQKQEQEQAAAKPGSVPVLALGQVRAAGSPQP